MAPAATGPVSDVPSPLVSVNGVTPSLLNSCNVVPAGKVLVPVVTLKVSVALPVLVSVLVKLTMAPGAAGPATV